MKKVNHGNDQYRNPKAKRLLQDLVDLKLISIKSKSSLKELLEKLRQYSYQTPSLDEITAEVEQVRKARNAK